MNLVVDASVAVKWFVPDPETEKNGDRALQLLGQIRSGALLPVQPPHWVAEVAAVIARLRPEIARDAVDLLIALEIPVDERLGTYRRAVEMATELEHHLFDTLYHAVALERDVTLVTADQKYARKALPGFGNLATLGSWEMPETA